MIAFLQKLQFNVIMKKKIDKKLLEQFANESIGSDKFKILLILELDLKCHDISEMMKDWQMFNIILT